MGVGVRGANHDFTMADNKRVVEMSSGANEMGSVQNGGRCF